jgi:hypothetical protein
MVQGVKQKKIPTAETGGPAVIFRTKAGGPYGLADERPRKPLLTLICKFSVRCGRLAAIPANAPRRSNVSPIFMLNNSGEPGTEMSG